MYTIKILANDRFDSLPYKDADVSLGLADPAKNTAYVRYTAWPELNKYLIDHEFEHLIEEVPTDEEDGIRYKKFRQAIGNIGSFAGPILGGIFGGPMGAAAGGAIGGGLKGGIGGQKPSWQGGLKGAGIGGATGYFGSKLLGNFGASNPMGGTANRIASTGNTLRRANAGLPGLNPLQRFGAAAKSGFGIGNMFKGFGGGNAYAGTPQAGGNLMAGARPALNQVAQAGMQGAGSQGGSWFNNLFSNKAALGAGLIGGGLFGVGKPQVPELPDSVRNLQANLRQGSPLGQGEIDAATRQIDEAEGRALDEVRDLYRNIRPGSDPSTDGSFNRDIASVRERFAQQRADTVSGMQRGVNVQNLQQELAAANYDVDLVARKFAQNQEQYETIRNLLLQLGGSLVQSEFNANPLDRLLAAMRGGT